MKQIVAMFVYLTLQFSNLQADMVDIKLKEFISMVSNHFDKTVLLDKELDYDMTLINTKNITNITYFSMVKDILDNNDLVLISKKNYYYIKRKDTYNEVLNIAQVLPNVVEKLAKVYGVEITRYKDNNYIVTYKNKHKFMQFKRMCKKLSYADTLKITGEIYKLNNSKLKENDIDISLVINSLNQPASTSIDMTQKGLVGFDYKNKNTSVFGFIKFLESNGYLDVVTRPNFLTISGQKAVFKSGYTYRQAQTQTDNLNTQTPLSTTTYSDEDIGLNIFLTPTLYSDGKVKIDLEIADTSLSAIDENKNIVKSQFEYISHLIIELNKEIVIAGVDVLHKEKTESKVPFLGDIYGIGYFFRSDSDNEQKSVIVIRLKVQRV